MNYYLKTKVKQFIFIFLLCLSINGFSVSWEKVTESNDGNAIYIDIDNIETNQSRIYYSTLIDFFKPKRESFSAISKYRVDCGEEQISWLSTNYFGQPMGKGQITSTSTVKQIRNPQTDAIARAELLFVCRRSKLLNP